MRTKILVLLLLVVSTGCATARTKHSDKNMRVMVDPSSIDYRQQIALQTELVKTDKFTVVDRNAGFKAIKQEQLSAFRTEADRYADREKFAHYGELYGVGSVVVAHIQCKEATRWYNNQSYYQECHQYLNMVDTNSGEVIVAVDKKINGDRNEVLSWEDAVNELVNKYPTHFENHKLHKKLLEYKDETEKLAQKTSEEEHE